MVRQALFLGHKPHLNETGLSAASALHPRIAPPLAGPGTDCLRRGVRCSRQGWKPDGGESASVSVHDSPTPVGETPNPSYLYASSRRLIAVTQSIHCTRIVIFLRRCEFFVSTGEGWSMKRAIIILSGGILASAMFVGTVSAQTSKGCQRSCTEVVSVCVKMGASQAACSADMANCMSTGNLHMPSGRTFTNLCKK
jgi:hypothetical protein